MTRASDGRRDSRSPGERGALAAGLLSLALVSPVAQAQPAPAETPVVQVADPAPRAPAADGPAPPEEAPPPPNPARPPGAILLDQAGYWRAQSRGDLAAGALRRLLATAPADPVILLPAIELSIQLGETELAQRFQARLPPERLTPQDANRAEGAMRAAALDPMALAEARALAQEGRHAEAVAAYRRVFGGNDPPEVLAVEFYSALSQTGLDGFRQATAALRAMSRANPSNLQLAFATAHMLTLRETTRSGGIDWLERLSREPAIAESARAAWRQALLWQGPSGESFAQYEAYLARYPDDEAIRDKRAEARSVLPGPGFDARLRGFEELAGGRLAEGAQEFERAIALDAEDVDAIMGLALARALQRRDADATRLLDRAIVLAPHRREEFLRMLGRLPGEEGAPQVPVFTAPAAPAGRWAGGPPPLSVQARRATQRGDYERAERLAERAARQRGSEALEAVLVRAQIALARNDLRGAEALFREALAARPRNPEAQAGLFEALQRQSRFAEADAFRLSTGLRPWRGWELGRAATLREQAASVGGEEALALLREARQIAPADPWVRADLVRLLRQRGEVSAARIEEDALVALGTPDAMLAAASLADNPREAAARLERIPPRRRPAGSDAIIARARQLARLDAAEAARNVTALDALAGERDPAGLVPAAAMRALTRLDCGTDAVAAADRALARNPEPEAQIAIASALLEAGAVERAGRVAERVLAEADLTGEQRLFATVVAQGAAVREAVAWREAGRPEIGAERLAPFVRARPGDDALVAADGWLRLAANQPQEAGAAAATLLDRNPANREARRMAVAAAQARGDNAEAERLVAEGLRHDPSDPALWLADARLRRQRGDSWGARRAYDEAERLAANGDGEGRALIADIQREQQALGTEPLPMIQAGLGVRARSGEAGRSRLTEFQAPVEVSVPVPGIGGRFSFGASTTHLDAGRLTLDGGAFPYGGLVPWVGQVRPGSRQQQATGVALTASYAIGALRVDIGSTPLGFRRVNLVGGVEVAPAIAEQTRLRLIAERRAVTDSILAYAGAEDPATGRSWGGVTRTTLRAQLEHNEGRWRFYGGGSYGWYGGTDVADNTRWEIGGGVARAVVSEPGNEVLVGVDVRHVSFERNLRYFSLGHGGYFSPQSWTAAALQVQWARQTERWRWRVLGALGWQTFREDSAPFFPLDNARQSAFIAGGGNPFYPGQRVSGLTGGLQGEIEYAVTPAFRLGALARFERTGDFNQGGALLYARYWFLPPTWRVPNERP
ncbi:MAG: BCSC C-terminal domain-containing protein [Acetobacteraceae bacterium]|nr:BCSC C-terminal domain-containing protein [Acetobacteraceae bacterium]